MSSKALIFLSIVLTVLSVYLYVTRDKITTEKAQLHKRIDYIATGVQSIQTNEDGKVTLEMSADEIHHNLETDTLMVDNINAHKKFTADKEMADVSFKAKQAVWNRPKHEIEFTNGVDVKRSIFNAVTIEKDKPTQPKQIQKIKSNHLVYNTKSQLLTGKKGIEFNTDKTQIKADGISADLSKGQFDFDKLQAVHQR